MTVIDKLVYQFGELFHYLPESIVFGKSFELAKKWQAELDKTKDKESFIKEFQKKKLNDLIQLSKLSTYYRNKNYKLNDFERIEFSDKNLIRSQLDDFTVKKSQSDYMTTGGTSGKPFGFYIDKSRKGAEWFFMTSHWERVAFDRTKSWRAVLRNHIISEDTSYFKNNFLREICLSNYNLSEKKLFNHFKIIDEMKLKYIHAYPSAAYNFCKFLAKNNLKLKHLKAFLCGSESVFDYQKDLIENQLSYRMFTWYGHSEKLVLAAECEHSNYYHANPLYGYMELVNEEGKLISEPGKIGEIVGSSFLNKSTVFMRYKTGDFAEYVGSHCEKCGRQGLIFKNTVGRWEGEKIYLNENEFVTTTALNMHSQLYENIKNMQYFQDRFGILEVRVVPDSNFSENDKLKIENELLKKTGPNYSIKVIEVNDIEYTQINKYKLLIQKLNI